jgi:hypothetical protein
MPADQLTIGLGYKDLGAEKAVISLRQEIIKLNASLMASRAALGDVTTKRAFERISKDMAKTQQQISIKQKSIGQLTSGKWGLLPANFADGFTDLNKEIRSFSTTKVVDGTNFMNGAIKRTIPVVDRLVKSKIFSPTPFAGWAMSVMFAGLAIQRLMTTIRNFGTKTFKEIYESVEGNVSQVTLLEGSFKYLGFTIGAALEPVLTWLIPVIDRTADWISENEKLFGTITVVATALGGLSFLGGSLVLAVNGFKDMAAVISTMELSTLAVSAALVAIGAITWKAFKETPEAFEDLKNTFKDMKQPILDVWDSIKGVAKSLGITSWSDIAWGIAWFVKVAAGYFTALIQTFTLVFHTIEGLINAFRALFNAITFDFDAADEFRAKGIAAFKKIPSDLASIGMTVEGANSVLLGGVMPYRQEQERVAGLKKGLPEEYLNPTTIVINECRVENPNSFTDFVNSIKRQSNVVR